MQADQQLRGNAPPQPGQPVPGMRPPNLAQANNVRPVQPPMSRPAFLPGANQHHYQTGAAPPAFRPGSPGATAPYPISGPALGRPPLMRPEGVPPAMPMQGLPQGAIVSGQSPRPLPPNTQPAQQVQPMNPLVTSPVQRPQQQQQQQQRPIASTQPPQQPMGAPMTANQRPSDLAQSMQIMNLHGPVATQQNPSRPSRRKYPMNPEIASLSAPAPWPHGLPAQSNQQQQQQQYPPQQQQQQQLYQQQQNQQYYSQQQHQQQQQPLPGPIQPTMASPGRSSQSSAPGLGYHQGPYTHTGQNLPPDLQPPQQPRRQVDPDQMPAPPQVREANMKTFQGEVFDTLKRDYLPLATTFYIGRDQGNCDPHFMRSTLEKFPCDKQLADKSKLPIGLVIQPLAVPKSDDISVSMRVVDHEEGPLRCTRCRAYINPWCTFTHGGSRYTCSLCHHPNEVPSWYFSNLNEYGRRLDERERFELRYGSVEFRVPSDYYSERSPAPLNYVFAIDVSEQAVKSGMVKEVCIALRNALYDDSRNTKLARGNRIGLLTFDRGVQFYNLHPSLQKAQILVVSDITEMFVPLQDGFLVDPSESSNIILDLLNDLPSIFMDSGRRESVYTAAVRGGNLALSNTGGYLHVFQSCLPTYGPDALKSRDDKGLLNTDKEKTLLAPQSEVYKDLAKESVKNGICVNNWLFASGYMDVATLGVVSELTGGDVRYFSNFNPSDGYRLGYQLNHDLHRETGFDGVLRIRCSNGLLVDDHFGSCHMSTFTDMDLAGIDEDKAIAAVLKYDSKLDVDSDVVFQCALLYTTREGERRVRVHNLCLRATDQIADVFRGGDQDTTISVMMRQAIFDAQHKLRKDTHKALQETCTNVLTSYRVNCAASTSAGQLILPEAFKLLPVYVHGAIRSQALRGGGAEMTTDIRSAGMKLFNTLGVAELVFGLYPRMYRVDLAITEGTNGLDKIPDMTRVSYSRLDETGAYILDSGSNIFFWLGRKTSPQFIQEVFGSENLDNVDPNLISLPGFENDRSHFIHYIMSQLQAQRTRCLQLRLVRQDKDQQREYEFATWMTEDRNTEVQPYVDYMCVLHRQIQEEIKKLDADY